MRPKPRGVKRLNKDGQDPSEATNKVLLLNIQDIAKLNDKNIKKVVKKDTKISDTDTNNSEVNAKTSEIDTTNSESNVDKCINSENTVTTDIINISDKDTSKKTKNNNSETPSNDQNPIDTVNNNMDTDENNTNISAFFSQPSTSRGPKTNITNPPNVITKNRFAPLQNSDDDNDSENEDEMQISRKPPPIVIHCKTNDHKSYVKAVENVVTKGFHIKYTNQNTNLYIYNQEEYKKYLELLKGNETLQYHTYTPKNERKHAFILRGMDSASDTDEIKEELENQHKMEVDKVFKLKNTNKGLFLVVCDSAVTLKYLNKNIRYVNRTKVTWERRHNIPPITQCRRCQAWGHSTSNCYSEPKCLKCADSHWTRECQKVKKEDPNTNKHIKCANCLGNHLAFDKECPVFLRKLELKNKTTKERLAPKFVAAPIPTTNPWFKNRTANPNTALPQNTTAQPTQQHQQQQQQQTQQHPNNQLSGFNELTNEIAQLNQLINIEKMLQLVKELNAKLRSCTSEMEKFLAFNNFVQNKFVQCP